MQKQYSCALITGASSGLGEEFAKQLIGRAGKMILVARSADKLERLSAEIREASPETSVVVVPADLSKSEERTALFENLSAKGMVPDLLVNNAGLGDYGEFLTAEWGSLQAMLDVNIEALTHLSHLFAPGIKNLGGGDILNVSSLASTLPIPDFAVYAATKAYVSSFSEALRIELKEANVNVLSLCPGPVKTGFGEVARRAEGGSNGLPANSFFYVKKEQVVAEALQGLDKGCARVFPGLQIAAAGLLLGALPLVALRVIMGVRPRK